MLLCDLLLPLLLQGDDDLHSLLHDLSSSPTLPESTALIWGSSEEVGADARPGSSCSGSILQPDSPMGDSQVRQGGHSGSARTWPPRSLRRGYSVQSLRDGFGCWYVALLNGSTCQAWLIVCARACCAAAAAVCAGPEALQLWQ